jgi:hypothetical protein
MTIQIPTGITAIRPTPPLGDSSRLLGVERNDIPAKVVFLGILGVAGTAARGRVGAQRPGQAKSHRAS